MIDDVAKKATRSRGVLFLYELVVVTPAVIGIVLLARDEGELEAVLLLWSALIAAIEMLPVPAWGGLTISVGFPVLMVVAILYPPGTAGLITLIGMTDPREFQGKIAWHTALFNRSQVALSVAAASAVFSSIATLGESPSYVLILAAAMAAGADYAVNVTLVTGYVTLQKGMRPLQVLSDLRIGGLRDFLISYLGLGVLGLAMAFLFAEVGAWSIPVYLAPLLLARQVFFRSQALEEAHKELQESAEILRQLSNTMAEERADERLQIAGYLHDDLAQVLFRLSLQVDVARKLLDRREWDDLADQLEKIRGSKQETSDRVRALIRDLHRSPLGAKGLAEALDSFLEEVGGESGVRFHLDVEEMPLPAPIALLLYHVGREGVMNALKHAEASDLWISVREEDDDIVLRLKDDGRGFDTTAPGPEGHFGMAMMRERAKVGGGTLDVESTPGQGTEIMVRFPSSLLLRDDDADSPQGSASRSGRVSPGTSGTTSRGAGDSRDSVPA